MPKRLRRNMSLLPEILQWIDAEAEKLGWEPALIVEQLVRDAQAKQKAAHSKKSNE